LHELQREVDVKNVGKKAETATALSNARLEATRLDMTSTRTIAVLEGFLDLDYCDKRSSWKKCIIGASYADQKLFRVNVKYL